MKQIFTLALTFLLIFSLVTVTAFAEPTINTQNGTATKAVTASYSAGAGGGSSTVYSVDITWDSMAFTYREGSGSSWNPNTHTYTSSGAGVWSSNGNTITVTNHSNTQVTATLTYDKARGYEEINGNFGDKSTMTLMTAEDTQFANAPTDKATLSLSGKLDSTVTDPTTVGTITVTIR